MTIQVCIYLGAEKDGKVIQLENYVRHVHFDLNESGMLFNTNKVQFSINSERLASATHIILKKGSFVKMSKFKQSIRPLVGDQLFFPPRSIEMQIGV